MNNIAAKVLGSVAEKTGKVVLKQILQEYGGESGQRFGELLLGDSVEKKVDEIDKQLKKLSGDLKVSLNIIKRKADNIQITQLFDKYNECVKDIEVLLQDYNGYEKDSLKDSLNKRNSYENLLKDNGILYQVKFMMSHLTSKNLGLDKSYLEYYASILLEEYTDIFDFCNKLDSVISHFKFYLILAISLHNKVIEEAKEYNETHTGSQIPVRKDVEIKMENIEILDAQYYEIVKDVKKICNQFDECQGVPIMLQHLPDQKYLTGYKDGQALSQSEPFKEYDYVTNKNHTILGMPQIFLNGLLAKREVKKYSKFDYNGSYTMRGDFDIPQMERKEYDVSLDGKAQKWKLIKKNENGIIYFMFQHQESDLILDGISKNGTVYLSKLDDNNRYLRWQPIFTKNPSPYEHENGYFILRHMEKRVALGSNGLQVYGEESKPSHENMYMKWRLVTDTLFPGEFLTPGQKLLSMNGRISLTYFPYSENEKEKSGLLVLLDRETSEVLWKSQPGQSGVSRCCMQEDGNFVTYAENGAPTWASNSIKPKEHYCRLIVGDSGNLVIIDKDNNKVWSKP